MTRLTGLTRAGLAAGLLCASGAWATGFERIATWPVCENSSCDPAAVAETAAEIIAAWKGDQGLVFIYTDSPLEAIGLVDASDPASLTGLGTVSTGGEPTSVAVQGDYALVGVNTSPDFLNPSGFLAVYDIPACLADIATCAPVAQIDLGGQPDSVASSPDGTYAAVAIENERDEDACPAGDGSVLPGVGEDECEAMGLVFGGLPQYPSGYLSVIDTADPDPANWTAAAVDLTGLAVDVAPDDAEVEYVDINDANQAVATLQENNGLVVVDLATRTVLAHGSAGAVTLEGVDATEDRVIRLDETLVDVPREPDAVTWTADGSFATANEGDLFGGSRGWSIFGDDVTVSFDSDTGFEYLTVESGHFPEERAENKGAEPEGIEYGSFDGQPYIFVGSERGSVVGVYADTGGTPEFKQLLPASTAPEGLLALGEESLFVVASEEDAPDDNIRSTISVFAYTGNDVYPTIESDSFDGKPIGWGALSGLAASPDEPGTVYTIHDSFYAESRIYEVDVMQTPARIVGETVLTKDGAPFRYDLEGIAARPGGGFWLVSEGAGSADDAIRPVTSPNLLLRVSRNGRVMEEIGLPDYLDARQRRFGFEGVTVVGQGRKETVWVVFQREWVGDPDGFVRIGEYRVASGQWRFYFYPLDAPESPNGGWVGLSEIVHLGGNEFAVIERDNQTGFNAAVKRVYRFSRRGTRPVFGDNGLLGAQFRKSLAVDLLPLLEAPAGWVLDKAEGLTVAADGQVYVVTDNDGVDDSSGETQFLRLGDRADVGLD